MSDSDREKIELKELVNKYKKAEYDHFIDNIFYFLIGGLIGTVIMFFKCKLNFV